MGKLIENIDKLYTAEMGIGRINLNLPIKTDNVCIGLCKTKILNKHKVIKRKGKTG